MCRLALINKVGIEYIENNYGLENLFNYLERQLGGHGNGYCIIHKDGSYVLDKGVYLSNEEIAERIIADFKNIKWVIYHTRLASIGNICDENCHPFEHNGTIMCMNGTERHYKIVDSRLTDTENILLSSKDIVVDTRKYNSVFLGYRGGKVFANKNNGSLKYIPCANGGKIFASNFPQLYYMNETVYEAPQTFLEGKKMKPLSLAYNKSNNYIYRNKYDMYDYYDEYYMQGLR